MSPFSLRSMVGLVLFSGLFACGGGGGGGGGGSAGIDGSGAPAIAVVSGPINGFGSVIVDGVHYDTDNAEFWVRGALSDESALNVGSYIHLEGTVDANGKEGVAKRVYFQPNVIGAVSSVDSMAETFIVLGQTVQVTNNTAFDFGITPRDINGIRPGMQVEVSGPLNAEGEIIATRVGLVETAIKELAGSITNLDQANKTFRINNITVNYSKVGFVPALNNGQRVILRGGISSNGVIYPISIELEYKPILPQGQQITQTGLITRFVSAEDFTLGNFDITTNNSTKFINTQAEALALNVKATVAGRLVDGKLLADRITWLADPAWKIQGLITDLRNISLTGGDIKVQNTWLRLTPSVRLDSEWSKVGDRMKFSSLRLNDYVVVSGYKEGERLVVTSIEREEQPHLEVERKLFGFVQAEPLEADAASLWLEPKALVMLKDTTRYFENGRELDKASFTKMAAGRFIMVFGVMIDDGLYNTFEARNIMITTSPMPISGPNGPKSGEIGPKNDGKYSGYSSDYGYNSNYGYSPNPDDKAPTPAEPVKPKNDWGNYSKPEYQSFDNAYFKDSQYNDSQKSEAATLNPKTIPEQKTQPAPDNSAHWQIDEQFAEKVAVPADKPANEQKPEPYEAVKSALQETKKTEPANTEKPEVPDDKPADSKAQRYSNDKSNQPVAPTL